MNHISHSLRVLLLQELRNSLELNVTRAFIDSPDFAIPEHLLSNPFPDETHAAHPLDSGAGHAAGNLRGVQLGHGGVLDEVLASFLLAGGVIDQGAGSGDPGVGLGELVLHALEITNELAELTAIVPDVAVSTILARGLLGWIGLSYLAAFSQAPRARPVI